MYINITDSETADNKGSSSGLVHYLDKENRTNLDRQPECWFNGERDNIQSFEAMSRLDTNVAKLSKADAKFFLINISPSQKEIAFLKEKYGEKGAQENFKVYAAKVMDEYARNFKRPGIDSNKDLLWFGKLEMHRYYTHKDPEVKQGLKKRGEQKPGEHMHVQVIVSRKDITNRIKLSPMNKSRGRNAQHSQKMGQFDRSAFKECGEQVFDKTFGFDRGLDETFRYANSKKKGSLEERIALDSEKRQDETTREQQTKQQPKLTSVKQQSRKIQSQQQQPANYLKLALTRSQGDTGPIIPRKKKKKKYGEQQDQELSF